MIVVIRRLHLLTPEGWAGGAVGIVGDVSPIAEGESADADEGSLNFVYWPP